MNRPERVRYQLFLAKPASERFEALALRPGASKSAILAAAVENFLNHGGASEAERRFGARLDRISRQLGRIEQSCEIQLESFALFARYMLTVNAPLAEDDEAMRAIGRDRFAAFVARVGQQLAAGKRTFGGDGQ